MHVYYLLHISIVFGSHALAEFSTICTRKISKEQLYLKSSIYTLGHAGDALTVIRTSSLNKQVFKRLVSQTQKKHRSIFNR